MKSRFSCKLSLGSLSDDSFKRRVGIFDDVFDRSLLRFDGTINFLNRFHRGILFVGGDDCVRLGVASAVAMGRTLNDVCVAVEFDKDFSRCLDLFSSVMVIFNGEREREVVG